MLIGCRKKPLKFSIARVYVTYKQCMHIEDAVKILSGRGA